MWVRLTLDLTYIHLRSRRAAADATGNRGRGGDRDFGRRADARQEAERLERLWAMEAGPALQAASAATLEDLGRMLSEVAARDTEIRSARQEAAQLEQRAADQADWAGLLVEGSGSWRRPKSNSRVRPGEAGEGGGEIGIKTASEIDKRSTDLRESLERIAKEEKPLDVELSAANTRTIERQKALDEASSDWRKCAQG